MNKIFIIGIDNEKIMNVCESLAHNDIKIAHTFITNEKLIDSYKYYISEEQLNLDFKNKALLYVSTDTDEEISFGISIDEFYNKQLIPMSIRAFNTINKKYLTDNLIVWLDSKMNKHDYPVIDYKVNLIETKYLLETKESFRDNFLYFMPKDSIEYCCKNILKFINGDEEIRKQILLENS